MRTILTLALLAGLGATGIAFAGNDAPGGTGAAQPHAMAVVETNGKIADLIKLARGDREDSAKEAETRRDTHGDAGEHKEGRERHEMREHDDDRSRDRD